MFSEMDQGEKLEINTLKETVGKQQAEIKQLRAENEQLKAADAERAAQLQQMQSVDNARGIEMNRLKERSAAVQRSAETLAAKHDDMREWYNNRNTTLVDSFTIIKDAFKMSMKRVNALWLDRCKAQEVLHKRDHDRDDRGNPDAPASSEQSEASASTQIVVYSSEHIVADPVALGGSQEELERLDMLENIENIGFLLDVVESMSGHAYHPVTGEELDEREFLSELSSEQILALSEMKVVDDATIDEIPSESEVANLDDLKEIVFEDENEEKLKSRDTSDVHTDTFDEWRKKFLAKIPKPAPPPDQVDYKKYEKIRPRGIILSCMFVKEIHCMAVKREHGIQYFKLPLSILTLLFYDVAALAKMNVISQSNFEGVTLFSHKLRMECRKGWKDELYKPQFPMHEQIKHTLDPETNAALYKHVYKLV
ncbi:hypothetical protein Hanom_Chr07g00603031 [Helianthus anomalus]